MERCFHVIYGLVLNCAWLINVNVDCGTWNDTTRLAKELLRSYDVNVRPIWNQSEPIVVFTTFDIKTIQDFDEVAGKLTISGYMTLSWFDELLTWDSSVYDTNSVTFPRKSVWYPTIVLVNSYSKLEDVGDDWLTVHVSSNGLAVYVPGGIYTLSCTADVTLYPFDQQSCSLIFIHWGYTSDRLRLQLYTTEVLTTYFSENGEWTYVDAKCFQIPGGNHQLQDAIGFTIFFKRKSAYLIVSVILPVVFISLINILVFVLPAESGERVSFSLTAMLSLAVFLTIVEDNLPKTSDPIPKLSYYLMVSLISSVMICLYNVFSIWVFFKKDDNKVPAVCKRLVKISCIRGSGILQCDVDGKFNSIPTDKSDITSPRLNSVERKPDDQSGNQIEEVVRVTDIAGQSHVTWIDVSAAIDRFSAVFFIITLMVNNSYLASIAFNHID